MLNKSLAFVAALALSFAVNAVSDKERAAIEERIAPYSDVCLKGDANCGSAAAAGGGAPKSGKEVYASACVACHSTGVAGSPKLGDAGAWKSRLDKGIDTVYANAIGGIGGMPPMGTCFSCSEDEIRAAIDYIIDNSK